MASLNNLVIAILSLESIRNAIAIQPDLQVSFEGFKYNSKSALWEKRLADLEEFSDFVTNDVSDFSVVDTKVAEVVLICRGSMPVYWEFVDVQTIHLDKIFTNTKAVYDVDGDNYILKEFQALLHLYNTPSLTGGYKCRSVSGNEEKNIHVFLPGTENDMRRFTIPHQEVTIGINNETILLPCKVTQKDINTSLLVESADDNEDWDVATFKSSFDPRKGFFINTKENNSTAGRYKCISGSDDSLIVNIRQDYDENSTFPHTNLNDGIAMWRRRRVGDGIECCSNSSNNPKMLAAFCENKPHCDMIEEIYMQIPQVTGHTTGIIASTTSDPPKNGTKACVHSATYLLVKPFLFQCFGDGIDFSGEIVTEFIPSQNDLVQYVAPASTEVYSPSPENTIRIQVMKLLNYSANADDSGTLMKIDVEKDSIFVGEDFILDCCGLFYHHGIGRIQRIGWKNGTVKTIPTPEKAVNVSEVPYLKDFCYTYLYDVDMIEPYILKANKEMSYFECMVPVWNSGKPVVKRIDLKIRVQSEPILADNANGTWTYITYDQNQVGVLRLDCSLLYGDPPPKMTWFKDGHKINQTDKHWSLVSDINPDYVQVHGSGLLFMRAVKEIQGKYLCKAENIGGKAQKSFYVTVRPRSYIDYWVALGIFGGFFLVIICCALRVTTLDKPGFAQKVKPETEIADTHY